MFLSGIGRGRALAAAGVVSVLLSGAATATTASASGIDLGHSAVCTSTLTLSFNSPIGNVPSLGVDDFSLSGTSTCFGGLNPLSPFTLSMVGVGATGAGSSCSTMQSIFGTATVSAPVGVAATTDVDAAGPTEAQTWVFIDHSGAYNFEGTGEYSWSALSVANCVEHGTTSMTLTGVLTFAG